LQVVVAYIEVGKAVLDEVKLVMIVLINGNGLYFPGVIE